MNKSLYWRIKGYRDGLALKSPVFSGLQSVKAIPVYAQIVAVSKEIFPKKINFPNGKKVGIAPDTARLIVQLHDGESKANQEKLRELLEDPFEFFRIANNVWRGASYTRKSYEIRSPYRSLKARPKKSVFDSIMGLAEKGGAPVNLTFRDGRKTKLDSGTARLLKQVYEALSPTNQGKFRENIDDFAHFMAVVELAWSKARFGSSGVIRIV